MDVQALIDELEQGADDAAIEIAAATLAERTVGPATVAGLLEHAVPAVRRAATLALGQRRDSGALELLRAQLGDSHAPVRAAAVQALASLGDAQALEDVLGLLNDRMAAVRLAAAQAARAFPSAAGIEALERTLARESSLDVKVAAGSSVAAVGEASPELGLLALGCLARLVGREREAELVHPTAQAVAALAQGLPHGTLVEVLRSVPISGRAALAEALSALEGLSRPLQRVTRELQALPPDEELLARFGSNLTRRALDLPRCYGRDEEVFSVLRQLDRAGPRAVVLVGPAGVGKSAIVHALARQLAAEATLVPRVVHEVTTGEVLSGTRYLGEWQTRLKELQGALSAPHRAVWYLPDLNRLVDAGTTAHSDESFATMLRPAIERGELAIVGESTPEAFRHGLDRFPGFRKLFWKLELQEPDAQETLEILEAVTQDLLAEHRRRGVELEAPRAALELAVELADDYISGLARPGCAISLVREALGDLAEDEQQAGRRVLDGSRLLHTISRQSGVPVALLDDSVQLDLREVHTFFDERVLGQAEVVEAMVDLIGRIKAGLTDPARPLGVFFFVGPTGVGKTEMAKTVAEYIFGSPERLVRIDLGEFKEPDAHRRLVGDPLAAEPSMRSGLLTAPVRERPFSVVLLDEVEKAHRNVFDLLLPLMAEGRLTDERGRVTDFRHTIVIMTSNLGSDLREDNAIGFGFTPAHDKIQRVMEEVFRPEFLNRIGKTILFSPLSVEVMRRLTRREVRRVLSRRGIRRRSVIVELDDSLVGALVRDGFSARYGARPLKRRVEEVVLNPLARALLKTRADGPQTIVRLGVQQGRPAWELILERKDDPDDDDALAVSRPTARLKDPQGRRVSLEDLREQIEQLHERVAAMETSIHERDLRGRKSELLAASTAPDLWDDPARAGRILSEIHQLEVQLEVPRRLAKRMTSLDGLLERVERRSQETALLHDLLVRLDDVSRDVEFSDYALRCSSPHERGDAYLLLRLVGSSEFPKDAIALMAQMYRRYWRSKGQRARVVYEGVSHQGVLREAAILLEGTCAYGLFRGEHGLHQWVHRSGENQRQKEVCFVRVTPLYPAAEPLRTSEVTQEVRALRDAEGVLLKRPRAHLVLTHTPTSVALEGHTDGSEEAKDWARALLAARVARAHDRLETLDPGVIRRYVSGRNPVAREFASNLKLPLERVLEGELDEFILPRVFRGRRAGEPPAPSQDPSTTSG
ncbi:MAG: AAA family ATPase [Planctomycetes bacterium]|nr:AAA family ATPase [Planctomycetota bacterium]